MISSFLLIILTFKRRKPVETASLIEGSNRLTMSQEVKDGISAALEKSSEVNRTLGISFALVLVYITVNVFNTTDRMLLMDDSIFSIPVINISLSTTAFYVLAPILLVLLHFNLLFNQEKHCETLIKWRELHPEADDVLLHPYLINYLGRGKNLMMKGILWFIVNFTVNLAPLVILFFIQYRYADVYDIWLTGLHALTLFLDGIIIYTHTSGINGLLFENRKRNLFWYIFLSLNMVLMLASGLHFAGFKHIRKKPVDLEEGFIYVITFGFFLEFWINRLHVKLYALD